MSHKHFTHKAFLTHVVSLDLLDYLCPVRKKEVLKVDAFRDLLNKTCQQPTGWMTKEGTSLVVHYGELVTSVSELARQWNWHRDKVRDFINELAYRDVLTFDMHKKFMVLSFPNLAERIEAYSTKVGNDASAKSESSDSETSGEAKQDTNDTACRESDHTTICDLGIMTMTVEHHSGSEKKDGGKAPFVNGSHYHKVEMFSDEEMTGSQYVPDSTHLNGNI